MQKSLGHLLVSFTVWVGVLLAGAPLVLAQSLIPECPTVSTVGQMATVTARIVNAPTRLQAFGFDVTFDASVLDFATNPNGSAADEALIAGDLIGGFTSLFEASMIQDGRIQAAVALVTETGGGGVGEIAQGANGVLLQLNFTVLSLATTTLTITSPVDDLTQPGWTLGSCQIEPGTASPASLVSLSPSQGAQGLGALDVLITGENTSFNATSQVSFSGSGITVTSTTVRSATQLTVRLGIDAGATLGARNAQVTTGSEVAALPNGFEVTNDTLVPNVFASILPTSRSVQVGTPATVFVTILNPDANTPIRQAGIILQTAIPATSFFQTTDPNTNALMGTANTRVDIAPGAFQTYLIAITPAASVSPGDLNFAFQGANANQAVAIPGVNTLSFSAAATPIPDIVALAATPTDPGIANIPGNTGTGFFAVATVNVGTGGMITASADTGTATLPVSLAICQTNPTTGVCLQPPNTAVSIQINALETSTFAIFATGTGNVPFDPATNRIFVRFEDNGGVTRGSTSVAVRTQ